MEKLAELKPAFDRLSGRGTLTAGNSSPLTDGAAAIWVATREGLEDFATKLTDCLFSGAPDRVAKRNIASTIGVGRQQL